MDYRFKLFWQKFPYSNTSEVQDLFTKAVKENCLFHYHNCPEYRKILEYFHFIPSDIKCDKDIEKIPFLPTLLFKKHHVFSMPKHKTLIEATSSGTKGLFSRIRFEASGLFCGLKMVLKLANHRKLFSPIPTHYIVLGYKPNKKNKTAVTKTAFGATLFAPALSRTYALKYQDGKYSPDLSGVISAVLKHSGSLFPLRFMGFPSYIYFMLKQMEEQGISLQLRKGSKIMLAGGWKQFYTEQVDKKSFYALAYKVLNISEENIFEFFGAVEHPIMYCDCEKHHFHIPVYSRVIIRDVNTLKPLKNGQVGLINLITPMVKATPILSVMTDDLGVLHDGNTCGCGISSPYLEIVGRVGLKDIKTCAAGAAEFLSEVRT